MNSGRYKPLGRGSSVFSGSLETKILIALILIIIVLVAVIFSLYLTNKSQEATMNTKQAYYEAANANLSRMKADYAALTSNNSRTSNDFDTVKTSYDNLSAQYAELRNRSSLVDDRLNTFLENDPTIAFTYTIAPKMLPDNTADKVVNVTAYNLGKTDAGTIKVICTINEGGNITSYNKTFTQVRSLDKRQTEWELGSNDTLISVWAGLG